MEIPDDLAYTETHEWVKMEGKIAVVGITDHAQHELTDIVYIDDFPDIGDNVEKGATIAVIESVKAVAEVYAPVSGKVTEINDALENNPEQINTSPYDSWIIKINPSDENEIAKLLCPDNYAKLLS